SVLHVIIYITLFFFSSRRRHTRSKRDWSSDVCSSDLDSSDLHADTRSGVRDVDVGLLPDLHLALDPQSHVPALSRAPRSLREVRSEERRVGKECRSRWSRLYG